MNPYSFLATGTYVNAATALPTSVPLNDRPDFFMVRDVTNWGANGAGSFTAIPALESWICLLAMANGSYRQLGQVAVATTAASLQVTAGTTNGFTFIDTSNPPTFAPLAATAINTTTWVVSMTNTGTIQVGDWVRVLNPTGAQQAGGIIGQVTAVTANTSITLGYIATAVTAGVSFTANATTSSILKFYRSRFYPKELQVMYITQAAQAVVYFAEANDFTPGEMVDFNIPKQYGMTQLSFLTRLSRGPARVLSVTNSTTQSSITLDLDTTGFTAFVYPTSAASVGQPSPPVCFPAGSGIVPLNGSATVPQSPPGTNLQDAFDNHNQYLMYLGSAVVGANSATMQWTAWRGDYNNLTIA